MVIHCISFFIEEPKIREGIGGGGNFTLQFVAGLPPFFLFFLKNKSIITTYTDCCVYCFLFRNKQVNLLDSYYIISFQLSNKNSPSIR